MADDTARFKKLRNYNIIMGIFHLVQSAAIFTLSNDFALPVTTAYPTVTPVFTILDKAPEILGTLRIGPMVSIFLLISAIAHLVLASAAFKWYRASLKKGSNYARWYEYALSSSVMIVVIAMLSGMYDIASLILIFTLNATMNLFGLMMELHNQTTEKTNWTSFIFGSIAGIVPWVVITIYFLGTASANDGGAPTFVYFILGSLFFLYLLFPVNMLLQYRKVGRWKDYLHGERMYVLLSLVAKSALAWQVFGGTLFR